MDLLAQSPILLFLEQVDRVLNSNTFLLEFFIHDRAEMRQEVMDFLQSGQFQAQILAQDLKRFGNYQRSNNQKETLAPLVKSPIELQWENFAELEACACLQSLLTTRPVFRPLQSPYRCAMPEEEAQPFVDAFVAALMQGQPWELLVIEPNFCYTKEEARQLQRTGVEVMSYFYDLWGDTALLLRRADGQAYWLLTNGSD